MMRAETVELVRALVLRRCHCASPPATQRKDAGFAKSGFVRAGEELRMSTPRAAVKLASLAAVMGLAALLSGPGFAGDDAVLPDIVLPEPPAATLMIEATPTAPEAPRASEAASPEPAAAPVVKAQTSP